MKKLITTSLLAILASTTVEAQELDITVTNLTHGSHFTPLLVAAHAATTQLFAPGKTAPTTCARHWPPPVVISKPSR